MKSEDEGIRVFEMMLMLIELLRIIDKKKNLPVENKSTVNLSLMGENKLTNERNKM